MGGLTPPFLCPIVILLMTNDLMDNFDFSAIDQYDRINEFDEDEDWTDAVLGDEQELIRQLVG